MMFPFNHAGWRTPAHCDASRISAGVQLENLPQQGQIMPSISKICPLCVQKIQNPPKFLHKPSPKPSQNLPKASQNPSRSSLGAHFGPMLERSSISNVQQTAKRRQKAPQGGRRRPQILPKWRDQDPSKIDFR